MPPKLTMIEQEHLSRMTMAFNRHVLTAGDFRTVMRELGFEDWEIDEFIEDRDADEP